MGFPFGGDPEDLMRGLREFAEQQAETVQEAQREQFATLTLNTAVELTSAALAQMQPKGGVDEQAIALRDAMRVLFPEAVALVSAARQGFMRDVTALQLSDQATSSGLWPAITLRCCVLVEPDHQSEFSCVLACLVLATQRRGDVT